MICAGKKTNSAVSSSLHILNKKRIWSKKYFHRNIRKYKETKRGNRVEKKGVNT
jgi:hypothetical protein